MFEFQKNLPKNRKLFLITKHWKKKTIYQPQGCQFLMPHQFIVIIKVLFRFLYSLSRSPDNCYVY